MAWLNTIVVYISLYYAGTVTAFSQTDVSWYRFSKNHVTINIPIREDFKFKIKKGTVEYDKREIWICESDYKINVRGYSLPRLTFSIDIYNYENGGCSDFSRILKTLMQYEDIVQCVEICTQLNGMEIFIGGFENKQWSRELAITEYNIGVYVPNNNYLIIGISFLYPTDQSNFYANTTYLKSALGGRGVNITYQK